jgi:hypothetical protein
MGSALIKFGFKALRLHEMKLNSQPQNLPYIITEQFKKINLLPLQLFHRCSILAL